MNWKTLAISSAFLLAPAFAFADIAPVMSNVGSIGPDAQSPVIMESETVTFTVPKDFGASDTGTFKANVAGEAKFSLKNSSDQPQAVSSVFPIYVSGEGGANGQYAKNVRVLVDGLAVVAALKDDASYPEWDGKNWRTVTAPGYAFSFTMAPGARREVVVKFDAPQTGSDGWRYMLSSGAGWGGSIEKATIKIVYPYALRNDWISVTGQSLTVNGDSASVTYSQLEPTPKHDLTFSILRPEFADAILKAEARTESQPSVAQGWLDLANAYRAVVYYHGVVPEWADAGYWQAVNTYLDRKYGSHTAPTTVEGATAIAEVVTDHWTEPCDGAGCRTWEDTEAANALLQHIRTVMLPAANTTDHDALVSLAGKLETWLKDFGVSAKATEPVPATTKPIYSIQETAPVSGDSANPWVLAGLGFLLGGVLAALIVHAIMMASRKK